MKQPLLITKSKVEDYLQIAVGYAEKDFNRFIREAQEFDLKPLLCDEFYFDMLENAELDPFDKVIAGQKYEYEGKTYYHEGLEAVLSYFTYARFLLKSDVVSTTHGMRIKKTTQSDTIGIAEKKDLYHSHRQDANKLFESVARYMDLKDINYKDCSDCGESPSQDIVVRAQKW